MEKKTIEQLLNMPSDERGAYLQTLPEAERKRVSHELFEAVNKRMVKGMTDNLNRGMLIEYILEMTPEELEKGLEARTLDELRKLADTKP